MWLDRQMHMIRPTAANDWTDSSIWSDRQQHMIGPPAAYGWIDNSIWLDRQHHTAGPTTASGWTDSSVWLGREQHMIGPTAAYDWADSSVWLDRQQCHCCIVAQVHSYIAIVVYNYTTMFEIRFEIFGEWTDLLAFIRFLKIYSLCHKHFFLFVGKFKDILVTI